MNTISSNRPITLCGFMACGKSTLGKLLAERIGFTFLDTDQMLLEKNGMTIKEMFAIGGETYFRDREHEIVQIAAATPDAVISTGGGVMTFERNALLLAQHTHIIHISRSFDACYAAILRRKNRPLAAGKTREELRLLYDARIAAYEKYAAFTFVNDGPPQEMADALVRAAADRFVR